MSTTAGATRAALRRAEFLKQYLAGPVEVRYNATQTVLSLGWTRNPQVAAEAGIRVLSHPKTRAQIAAIAAKSYSTAEKAITRTAMRAYSDVRDVLSYDADGVVTLIPTAQLTEAGAAMIGGIKHRCRTTTTRSPTGDPVTETTRDLEVKLREDDQARRDLLKLHGLLKDRVEHSGPDGGPIAHAVAIYLPTNGREATPTPPKFGRPVRTLTTLTPTNGQPPAP